MLENRPIQSSRGKPRCPELAGMDIRVRIRAAGAATRDNPWLSESSCRPPSCKADAV